MKKLKTAAAMLLTAAMLSGLLAGCGGNAGPGVESNPASKESPASTAAPEGDAGSGEAAVVSYYYPVAPSEHDKIMWDSLNPYLQEKANFTVDYHPIDWGEYDDRTSTIVSSGQAFDVMFCNNTYFQKVQLGACQPVEDFLKAMDIWGELPDWLWDAATVGGHIYGVPTYKDCAACLGLVYNKTLCDELGVSVPASYKTEAELDSLFREAKQKKDAKYPEDANIPVVSTLQMFEMYDGTGTDFAAANIPGMEMFAGVPAGEKLINTYDTPEYEAMAKMHKEWINEGILPMDCANYDSERGLRNSGKIMFEQTLGLVNVDPHYWGDNFEVAFSRCEQSFVSTGYVMFGSNVIGVKSENPEAACKFLNLVNTDNFVANTIRFGVEGTYWNKTDDNRLDFTGTLNEDPQQRAYYNWYGWQFGKLFTMSLPQQESDTLWEDLQAANENAFASDNMGWTFDQSAVTTEIASCNAVKTEYHDNLSRGMSPDVDQALADFRAKLKAAGVEKITAEAQRQLNEWRKANGKSVAE